MPTRTFPVSAPPWSFNPGMVMMAAAYATPADLGFALPLVVNVGAPFTTDPILVAGLNAFMAVLIISAGGTLTISFAHRDPYLQTSLFSRNIAAGLGVGASPQIIGWGAFSGVGATDVYHTITLTFTAAAVQITVSAWALWGATR